MVGAELNASFELENGAILSALMPRAQKLEQKGGLSCKGNFGYAAVWRCLNWFVEDKGISSHRNLIRCLF